MKLAINSRITYDTKALFVDGKRYAVPEFELADFLKDHAVKLGLSHDELNTALASIRDAQR